MKNVVGIISGICNSAALESLTKSRPISTVPFGARYRLIDFALSNMVNTGIRTVGIVTPYNYRSVLDHIRSGKDWFLDRKSGGLFFLPGNDRENGGSGSNFVLRDLLENMDFLKKAREEYIIISCSSIVMNIDYREAVSFHQNNDNEVTFIYKDEGFKEGESEGVFFIEQSGDRRVKEIIPGKQRRFNGSDKALLNIVIINRETLTRIVEEYGENGDSDLFDILGEMIDSLRAYALEFRGYAARISSLKNYYNHSMKLLDSRVRNELFMRKNKIHTKITDNPPTRYGEKAEVINTLAGSGCIIDGHVEGSIIFREAQIEQDAFIKDSIIMQRNVIGKDVLLENVILDKFVTIKDGTVLRGEPGNPIIIEKAAVIGPEEGDNEKYNLRSG
ncbi:MAG: glucose-1-phosphate adenylyltransferase subunit GlgD [Clostridiales bacterium]|nr:glucose-1-phosphate adenylyltransferase subunit GlgD [Clostridiales bacterium]